MRRTVTGVTAVTAAGLLVLAAGCGSGSAATTTATVLVPVTVTVTAGAEQAGATTAPTSSAPTAAGATGAGTRADPVPAGTPATVGDWSVTFEPTVTDAADAVAGANQFNEAAPAGRQFVMAKVNATFNGTGSKRADVDLRITFVGVGGNSFGTGSDDYCGVIPDPMHDAGEVFAGATASGNECVAVASDQVAGGSWSVKAGFSSDATFFGQT